MRTHLKSYETLTHTHTHIDHETAICRNPVVHRAFALETSKNDDAHGDIFWPVRSPDLSACDFFLWVY
jgi:hypothetical protein